MTVSKENNDTKSTKKNTMKTVFAQ